MTHAKFVGLRRHFDEEKYYCYNDRFEEDWAVLEYKDIFNFPRALLPDDAKEGDVINIILEINRQETHKGREFIRKLEDELFE